VKRTALGKCSMKRTCLKSVLDDMTLWRTKRGEIREGRKEKWAPMLAWRAAAPRTRDNMTLSGFRLKPSERI
jgi:hypothetical protein